jgi:hypothetical protein
MRAEHPGENHASFRMALSPLNMLMLQGFSTFRGLNVARILMRSLKRRGKMEDAATNK